MRRYDVRFGRGQPCPSLNSRPGACTRLGLRPQQELIIMERSVKYDHPAELAVV